METDHPVLRRAAWIEAISILSMDLTLRFFSEMALNIPRRHEFQQVLRSVVKTYKVAIEADSIREEAIILEEVERRLSAAFGEAFLEQFRTWFVDIFRSYPQKPWNLYFSETAAAIGKLRHGEDVLFLGEAAPSLVKLFKSVWVEDIERIIANVKTMPLSDWDGAVYKIRRYTNDEESVTWQDFEGFRYPFAGITDSVQQNRFQSFWEKFLVLAPKGALARLQEEVQHVFCLDVPAPWELRRRVRF